MFYWANRVAMEESEYVSGSEERRHDSRKRSDPSVVKVLLQDENGRSRWVTAYLSNVTEGGAGLSLMTPLETGSRVVIKGNLGEGRTDVQIDADVRWCARGSGGVFNVGLKLSGKRSDDTV